MLQRNFLSLLLTNIVLGASMPMLIILGGLVGAELAPIPSLSTLAMSLQMLTGIIVATPISLLMGRIGRKPGFMIVAVVTIAGGVLGMFAVQLQQFWLLCVAHFILGGALTGVNFIRFAAGEVVAEDIRAKAISFTLASGLVAALIGPTIFELAKDWLASAEYAGAYLAIAGLGLLALLPIGNLKIKHQSADSISESALNDGAPQPAAITVRELLARPAIQVAIIAAAVSMAIMVLMMVPTPMAMVDHGHQVRHASDVIRWHVIAMFAPGLFTGSIIKRLGVFPVIYAGMVILIFAAATAISGTSLFSFYASLVLLGIGWNFGFVGGTHLLQSNTNNHEKAAIQGINDTIIAICSVIASVVSGALYISIGWIATSILVLPVLFVTLLILVRRRKLSASRARPAL